ncbi:MAG: hypothetical protein HDR57_03355 [Treponema sp.]|nr:hypothetical protein [Treponema sp.]
MRSSQIEFSRFWNNYKPRNGAQIVFASAIVTYQTDLHDMNKTVKVSKISISNADYFNGGKVSLLSDEFDSEDYFTEFSASFQEFEYDENAFIIRGNSMGNKNFGEYQVTFTGIEVLPEMKW